MGDDQGKYINAAVVDKQSDRQKKRERGRGREREGNRSITDSEPTQPALDRDAVETAHEL